jgi:transcriptional regulator with XRE-family HTH domain
LRRIKELSVNALASRADMTPERIRTLQAGADNPTLREIRQLAVAFETTEADLVTLVIEEARQP